MDFADLPPDLRDMAAAVLSIAVLSFSLPAWAGEKPAAAESTTTTLSMEKPVKVSSQQKKENKKKDATKEEKKTETAK